MEARDKTVFKINRTHVILGSSSGMRGGETDLKQLNHQFFSYYRCIKLSKK